MKKAQGFIIVMCLMLCIIYAGKGNVGCAEELRQSGQWIYRLENNGTAEILGYADPGVVELTIPTQLDHAWVTAIGEGAFASNMALEEITIPVQVTHIADTAFEAQETLRIKGWNGSEALRYAREKKKEIENLSMFDFFEDVLDLSEMEEEQWSIQDGELYFEEPFAMQVEPGDKLYLPARGTWSQGMPVRILSLTDSETAIQANYSVMSLSEVLESYHVDNVELYPDYSNIILGEGVSLAPTVRSAIGGEWNGGDIFNINKSFDNGVTVTGRVGVTLSVTASVDYEWLHVKEMSVSLREQTAIYLNVNYDGEEEDNASITRSFLLYRAPWISQGLVGVWMDVYVKIGLNGEATLESQLVTSQELTVRNGDVVTKRSVIESSEATLEANATLRGGLKFGPVIRLGFPNSENSPYVDLANFQVYSGIAGTASYTTTAPYCFDLNVKAEVTAEAAAGAVLKVGNDEKVGGLADIEFMDLTFPLWNKHWEGPEERWQDTCTYTDLCIVSIYTGTEEIVEPIRVKSGEKIGAPKAPEREGYIFTGWYADESMIRWFDFTAPIEEDVTLYAGWEKKAPEATPTPEPTPTAEPTEKPTEEPTPTQMPTTTWYPFANIPSAAESFALCDISEVDADADGIEDFYYACVPKGLAALTLSKTYRGKPVFWIWDDSYYEQPIQAVTYTNEYTTISDADIPPLGAKTVYLPDSVVTIDWSNVSEIAHIRLSNNLRSIPSDTFLYAKLEEIEIPDSVNQIGKSAFRGTNLRSVILPSAVTNIGDYAFCDCSNLQSVAMSNNVTELGNYAFAHCDSLKSIELSQNLTSIGNYAFAYCDNLESVLIPEKVTRIGEGAFYGCSNIEDIVIPGNVKYIGDEAFRLCTKLQCADIKEGVASIGDRVFSDCTSLESIAIPGSVGRIKEYYFGGYKSIKSVILGEGITTIGDLSFYECSSLESVVFPQSLTDIGEYAFAGCGSLKSIVIPGGNSIARYAFSDCTSLTSVVMGEGMTDIAEWAFYGCTSLETISMPDSVTHIGDWSFGNCRSLKEITLPVNLESLNYLFEGCSLLTEITTFSKTMEITPMAYMHDTNLQILRAYEDSTIAAYVREYYPSVKIVPPDSKGHIVSFETQRGTQPADLVVEPGELIPQPETPVWESRVFEGWYKDWLRTEPWDFAVDRMPDEDITLYAKWSYQVTGTIINSSNRSYLASLADPEENLTIPPSIGTSVIVGLMPDLVPPGVKTVHLSDMIQDVRPGAFRLATDLVAITVEDGNGNYYAVDGVLYTNDGTLVCYPAGKKEETFAVPSGVKRIEEYAFSNCNALEELTLPESLIALSPAAIQNCKALQRVSFASDLQIIGESNFQSGRVRLYGPEQAEVLKNYATDNGLSYNAYRLIYSSEGSVLAEILVEAGEIVYPIGGPTRAERILLGWAEEADAETPSGKEEYVMPAQDLTLYAVWGYAFSWQDSGEGVELLKYQGDQTIIRVPETVEGKPVTGIAADAFEGLTAFTLEGNRGSVTEAYAAANGYAFLPLSYTLRFESNGGTQLPVQELCATDVVEIPDCIRTGYDLEGWYVNKELTQRWTETTMPAEDLTLYAGWRENMEGEQYVPFTYRTEAAGIYITGYTGQETTVSVPEAINGVTVIGIDKAAFAGNTTIQNIYLPETVSSIGEYAFQGMISLRDVALPSTLRMIPAGIFQGCNFLKNLYIPDSVEVIESAAFSGCMELTSLNIPSSLTSLSADAFTGCNGLEWLWSSAYSEDAIFRVVDGCLIGDYGTQLLLYPQGSDANYYQVPYGVTTIDESVRFPSALEYLVLPGSINSLSVSNFSVRSNHLQVELVPGSFSENFFRENLPDIELTYMWGGLSINVRWEEVDTVEIGVPIPLYCEQYGAILKADEITWSVNKPEVAEITAEGVLMFHHAGQEEVTATLKVDPSQQAKIWISCTANDQLKLPDMLKEIEDEAFYGIKAEGVILPEGLERIGSRAFANCPWLFSVQIPSSVIYIADDAFSGSPYVCIFADEGSYAIDYAQRMNLNYTYAEWLREE